MKGKIIELIKSFCDDNEYEYTNDYSGRCMYGKKCVGFTCENISSVILDLAIYAIEALDGDDDYLASEVLRELGTPKMDNMGMDYILYFPSLNED